jgi:hypothetical protein
MSVSKVSLYINSSQEVAFQSVMDYFIGRGDKILISNSPSLVKAEIGSWLSLTLPLQSGTAKGEVEATIMKRNGGSYFDLNFNFTKEYVSGVLGAIFDAFMVYIISIGIASLVTSHLPSNTASSLMAIFNPVIVFAVVILFAVIIVMERRLVVRTRKRFLEEFNTFAQSLKEIKDRLGE